MAEKRICPICENKIPEFRRFNCPHCYFDLKWLDNETAIEREKQKYLDKVEKRKFELNFGLISILGGSLGFIFMAIEGAIAKNFLPQLLCVLIPCIVIGLIWKPTGISGKWGLFFVCVIIGVIAPLLLIIILFPGGY
jgi:hypothetical protein